MRCTVHGVAAPGETSPWPTYIPFSLQSSSAVRYTQKHGEVFLYFAPWTDLEDRNIFMDGM